MDPYKVLGVSPGDSPDEIKKKYRELVKKYHPDKVRNTPQESAYEEKLKQINEAYDILTKNKTGSAHGYSGGYGGYSSAGNGYYTGAYETQFLRVRQCINANNLTTAESILDSISLQNAEWHFLKGLILLRRGWYDGAKQHFSNAYSMDPSNPEYSNAFNQTNSGNYSTFYGRNTREDTSSDCCRICTCLLCMDTCCNAGSCCIMN